MKTPTKLEAPDGGWGILVCIGMALPFISGLAALPSFGLVFGDFLKDIGAETSAVSFITSAFFCAFSFAGLFSGSLFNRFGLRKIGVIGGALYFLGSVMQIFVTNVTGLLCAFSLVQGVGFGLIVPTSYTTFNNYFIKKRVMWMSFAQSLIGVGTMFYPVIMQYLLELYGFRGCLTVLAAINAHAILGMLLMQPVKWHMRKVPVVEEKLQSDIDITDALKENNGEDIHHLSPLMYSGSHHSSRKMSREDLKINSRRSSSITSLGNWTGPILVSDAELAHMPVSNLSATGSYMDPEITSKSGLWPTVMNFLDLTLMKEPVYVNIVLGISFALYSDIAFFTLQPLYLFELGFNKPETANIIAIGAAADLGSRIFLALSAVFIQMPSRHIYLAGSFFTVISRFAFLHVFDYTGMAFITAVMGFLRTWIHVPLPLVFAEYLPKERFAKGYGLFMFLQGNIMFIIGPIVGYLRDSTKNYVLTFHCINIFMALCAVPWLIEIIFIKLYRKNKGVKKNVQNNVPAEQ